MAHSRDDMFNFEQYDLKSGPKVQSFAGLRIIVNPPLKGHLNWSKLT